MNKLKKLSYDEALKVLKEYGQEHLLKYYIDLSEEQQEQLLMEISEVDFELMKGLYSDLVKVDNHDTEDVIEPMNQPMEFHNMSSEEKERYYKLGMNALKKGEVAALVVAGGQGTRLGHIGPKGTYNIGLSSQKSLFEIQLDRLKKLSEESGKYIYWYIMTSHENNKETVEFFEKNNYFGYPQKYINFYTQDQLPMLDEKGNIILKGKGEIALGPNGNGGALISLKNSGMLEHMKLHGIKWVSFNGIDNVLVKICDPYFIGYTVESGLLAGSKVVYKRNPEEKIGVFCLRNKKPSVVEYIEISKEMSEIRDENDKLVYGSGNILNYLFSVEFIEKSLYANLPYHVAHKKIPYMEDGVLVEPQGANGYKFESFIFDVFSVVDRIALLEVKREEEFAPVKNKEGEDSPESARKMYMNLYEE